MFKDTTLTKFYIEYRDMHSWIFYFVFFEVLALPLSESIHVLSLFPTFSPKSIMWRKLDIDLTPVHTRDKSGFALNQWKHTICDNWPITGMKTVIQQIPSLHHVFLSTEFQSHKKCLFITWGQHVQNWTSINLKNFLNSISLPYTM